MGDNEFRTIKDIKKEEKVRAYQEKVDAKRRKEEAKAERKAEKERVKYSFGRKVRNFFLIIIFVIALVIGAFFGARYYLNKKVDEINSEKSDDYFDNASAYMKEKEYDKALDELNKIDSDFEKYTEVKDMIKEAKLGLIDEKVDKLADKKDYLGILEFLNESLDDNKDLKKTINKYQDEYLDLFIDQVRELMKDDLESARDKVKSALNIMDSNKELKNLLEEIDKAESKIVEETKKIVEDETKAAVDEAKKKIEDETKVIDDAKKKAETEYNKATDEIKKSIDSEMNFDDFLNSL
ncbi:MAG: hypothetical protein IKG42_03435 [Clostridia bacterium]|nr:hypothetical protein [Clostridia bacterium]